MALITLTALRALCAELLVVRADKRTLTERESALTAAIRSGSEQWLTDGQGVRVGLDRAVTVSKGSFARSLDKEAVLGTLHALGATPAQIEACYKTAVKAASVGERAGRGDDR